MKTKKVQVSKEYTLEFAGNVVMVATGSDGHGGFIGYQAIDSSGQPTIAAHLGDREVIKPALDFWRECQPLGEDEVEWQGGRYRFSSAWDDPHGQPMVKAQSADGFRGEWLPFWDKSECPDPEKARRWWLANYPMPPGKGLDLATGKVRDLMKPGESWDSVGKRIVSDGTVFTSPPDYVTSVKSASTNSDHRAGYTWDMELCGIGRCPVTSASEQVRVVVSGDRVVRNGNRIRVVQIGDFTPDRALELAESLVKLAREVSAK